MSEYVVTFLTLESGAWLTKLLMPQFLPWCLYGNKHWWAILLFQKWVAQNLLSKLYTAGWDNRPHCSCAMWLFAYQSISIRIIGCQMASPTSRVRAPKFLLVGQFESIVCHTETLFNGYTDTMTTKETVLLLNLEYKYMHCLRECLHKISALI